MTDDYKDIDRTKWIENFLSMVRHISESRDGFPVAVAVTRYLPWKPEGQQYEWSMQLARGGKDAPSQQNQERMEKAMQFIMEQVAAIFEGRVMEEGEDELVREVRWTQ